MLSIKLAEVGNKEEGFGEVVGYCYSSNCCKAVDAVDSDNNGCSSISDTGDMEVACTQAYFVMDYYNKSCYILLYYPNNKAANTLYSNSHWPMQPMMPIATRCYFVSA